MKKQTLYLIISAVVMALVGIAVMIVVDKVVPQDPEDKLFGQMVELVDEADVDSASGTSYAVVDFRTTAIDSTGAAVGTVYNIKIKNSFDLSTSDRGYGYIELLVGIKEGLVTVEIVALEQSSSYVNGIQRYVYEYYDGVPYLSVQNIPDYNAATAEDTAAGSTASTSTSSIRSLVWRAIQMHYGLEESDPFITFLGEDYVIETDTTFAATEHVTAKQNIMISSEVPNGYIYTVTAEGDYEGYDGTHTGSITLLVIFNESHEIVKIYVPEDVYGHTISFMDDNFDYLDEFIGKTQSEIASVIDANVDLKTGASYSKALIEEILTAMVSEVA
jgi:hypothetical protein